MRSKEIHTNTKVTMTCYCLQNENVYDTLYPKSVRFEYFVMSKAFPYIMSLDPPNYPDILAVILILGKKKLRLRYLWLFKVKLGLICRIESKCISSCVCVCVMYVHSMHAEY